MIVNCTYVSGELLEGVKHVEAVEIYDASCQGVIVSDDSQGHHGNHLQLFASWVLQQTCNRIYFDCADMIIADNNSLLLPAYKHVFTTKCVKEYRTSRKSHSSTGYSILFLLLSLMPLCPFFVIYC